MSFRRTTAINGIHKPSFMQKISATSTVVCCLYLSQTSLWVCRTSSHLSINKLRMHKMTLPSGKNSLYTLRHARLWSVTVVRLMVLGTMFLWLPLSKSTWEHPSHQREWRRRMTCPVHLHYPAQNLTIHTKSSPADTVRYPKQDHCCFTDGNTIGGKENI